MEELTKVEVEKIFEGEDNLEDFHKYLKEYGIEDSLKDITFKHTKKRLETLLAIANEGTDKEISSKKDLFKRLLNNLNDIKEERASKEAIKEVYSNEKVLEHMDIKELDKEIKHAMRSYKKYEKFKKHEENIANKWIRTLGK
ncbi:MAG: hypothetical protein ACRDDY_04890 [Clostridium sp.]|uniref:hypothetical protein n=1 Tax=Clostridium sp. TaxID=1506 RepID=UPI003EE51BA2